MVDMLLGRAWIGLLCVLVCSLAPAQDASQSTAPPKLVPVETEATRAAAEACRDELEGMKELRASAEPAAIRAALRDTLATLLAVPDREASSEIADSLTALGALANELHDTECLVQALEPALAFRLATLEAGDARITGLRKTIGHACWELGRLERSKELLGQVLEEARRTLAPDDQRVCGPMSDYAISLYYLDDCEAARVLMTDVVARL